MCKIALVTVLAAMPVPGTVQAAQSDDNGRFVVFIHAGGAPAEVSKSVALELGRNGYVVRKPDNQRDTVGGPGVDYFNAADAHGAEDVAKIVNSTLPANSSQLKVRLQRIKNPSGYLGVWLF